MAVNVDGDSSGDRNASGRVRRVGRCAVALAGVALLASTATAQQVVAYHADPRPTVARGRLTVHVVADTTFHRARRIWVYEPPGYDARRASAYPLVLAFDGADYVDTLPLPMVLDTLIAARRIPPVVAMLVDDSSGAVRVAELGNARRFVSVLASQLLPWLRAGWNVTRDPQRVIVTGASAGGLGAAFVALARPDLFGNVWSQSGAFWRPAEGSNSPPYEWLATFVRDSSYRAVRFALDVGALEQQVTLGGSGPVFIDATRRFRDALLAKRYDVTYLEVPGGRHGEPWWRPRLAAGIVRFAEGWER